MLALTPVKKSTSLLQTAITLVPSLRLSYFFCLNRSRIRQTFRKTMPQRAFFCTAGGAVLCRCRLPSVSCLFLLVRKLPRTEKPGSASAPPGHKTPSLAWWSDRALRPASGSGVALPLFTPTGPVSRRAATPPSPTPAYAKYKPTSREPGPRVWGMVGKVYTPNNANQERFSSMNRASIRNQHPRNTCKHQRDPSAFSMKPRVYKPQKKMGGSWNSN